MSDSESQDKSESEETYEFPELSGSDMEDMSAECVEEYECDSDGNIKPGQGQANIPKVISSGECVRKDDGMAGLSTEEKRQKKALEKLDKKLRSVTKRHDKEKTIKIEPKLIKNKHKRQEVALMLKQQNRREAKIAKLG